MRSVVVPTGRVPGSTAVPSAYGPLQRTLYPCSVDEPHLAEVGDDADRPLVRRAVAGGPVHEEGLAEHEPLGHPAVAGENALGRQFGRQVPVAGVAAEQGVVAEDEVL